MLVGLHCSDEPASFLIRSYIKENGSQVCSTRPEKRIFCILGKTPSTLDLEILKNTTILTLVLTTVTGYQIGEQDFRFWAWWRDKHPSLITTSAYWPTALCPDEPDEEERIILLGQELSRFLERK